MDAISLVSQVLLILDAVASGKDLSKKKAKVVSCYNELINNQREYVTLSDVRTHVPIVVLMTTGMSCEGAVHVALYYKPFAVI